jgi:hypothetical protein
MSGPPQITCRRRRDLAKQGDAILKHAPCDTTTGAKQDRKYRRNERAESKRLARILDHAATSGLWTGTLNEEGPARRQTCRARHFFRQRHHHEVSTDATHTSPRDTRASA